MLQKLILTCCIFLFIAASAEANSQSINKSKTVYTHKTIRLPYFNAVHITGDVNLEIDTTSCRRCITVEGSRETLKNIKMSAKKAILSITIPKCATKCKCACPPPKIRMRICTPLLNQFTYAEGDGNININLTSTANCSCIRLKGNSKTNINGDLHLQKLLLGGKTNLSIAWLNSCDFYLEATDKARIGIAGRVGVLEANVSGLAWVNARYLNAQCAFVKTQDRSRLDVRVSKSLNALASQSSRIYYYQDPKFQAPYMQSRGSVINMTYNCCPPCDLCDSACCKNGWR
jgi:hypothetical protein